MLILSRSTFRPSFRLQMLTVFISSYNNEKTVGTVSNAVERSYSDVIISVRLQAI